MAEAGDIINEFKSAKPPEKVVIVGGIIAVAGISYYLYKKSTGGSATPAQGSTPGSQVAGYPSVGPNGTPVLPNGVNPVYDPNGNLVAFQNPPPPTPPTPTPTPTNPANWFSNFLGKLNYGETIRPGGTDVNGQRFWIGKTGNSNEFYAPVGTQIIYGAQGRVWIQPPGQDKQLLTGPGQTLPVIMPKPVVNRQSTQLTKMAAGVNH